MTGGEQAMEKYLRETGLSFRYEPEIGGYCPDYLIHHAGGDVVAEVFDPTIGLPDGRVVSFDSIAAVRNGFRARKRKQIRAAQAAGYPTVLVLGRGNSRVPLDDFAVLGAMFGRPGVRFSVDPAGGSVGDEQFSFLDGAQLQPTRNLSYSAVAVVRSFNPTLRYLQDAARELGLGVTQTATSADRVRCVEQRLDLAEALEREGSYDPDMRRWRLVIYRNPFAARSLSFEFGGPFDEHVGAFERRQGDWVIGRVALGRSAWMLPR